MGDSIHHHLHLPLQVIMPSLGLNTTLLSCATIANHSTPQQAQALSSFSFTTLSLSRFLPTATSTIL